MNFENFAFALCDCLLEAIEYDDMVPLSSTIEECRGYIEQFRNRPKVRIYPSLFSDGSICITIFEDDKRIGSEKIVRRNR